MNWKNYIKFFGHNFHEAKKMRKNETHKTIVILNNQKQSWVLMTPDGNVQCLQHYNRIFLIIRKIPNSKKCHWLMIFWQEFLFVKNAIYIKKANQNWLSRKILDFAEGDMIVLSIKRALFHNSSTLISLWMWKIKHTKPYFFLKAKNRFGKAMIADRSAL